MKDNNKHDNIETIDRFINKTCYRPVPPLIDDCLVLECVFCGEEAWLIEDIKHKKKCALNNVIKAIKELQMEAK